MLAWLANCREGNRMSRRAMNVTHPVDAGRLRYRGYRRRFMISNPRYDSDQADPIALTVAENHADFMPSARSPTDPDSTNADGSHRAHPPNGNPPVDRGWPSNGSEVLPLAADLRLAKPNRGSADERFRVNQARLAQHPDRAGR